MRPSLRGHVEAALLDVFSNHVLPDGGADRDSRDQARHNIPMAVMALDRLVSVKDYADFARTYAASRTGASGTMSK